MIMSNEKDRTLDSPKKFALEEYQEMFKDWFAIKREDGIIEIRMHTNDGPAQWSSHLAGCRRQEGRL